MAAPAITAPMPAPAEAIRAAPGGIELEVVVVPRASRSRLVGLHGGRLKVQVSAPPVDGAANAELCRTLAKALDVAKSAVEVARGQASKRKTVRVAGLDVDRARTLLGLACAITLPFGLRWLAAGALVVLGACQPITTEVELRVVLPDDASDLDATNNVTLVLHPDGFTQTLATVGLDFALDAELEPDDAVRQLSVFLARNETLLAWGRTPGFTYQAASRGAAVFVARPGRLSTFPLGFALDDPDVLAAHAIGRGLVALGSDGSTTFVDALTLQVSRAASLVLDAKLPAASDGILVGDALGGVQRLTWNGGIRSYRFDPGEDTWIERSLGGAGAAGAREGAAHLVDAAGELVLLYGGGVHTDVVAVSLLPSGGGTAVERVDGQALDAPRRGATAMPLVRDDLGLDSAVLFGSDDPALGVLYLVDHGQALGPEIDWLGGRCVQLDRGGTEDTLRVLCAGGVREGSPTADGLLLVVPGESSSDPPSTQLLPDLLGDPMSDPWWLPDADAVYAQGDGRLLRVDPADLTLSEVDGGVARSRGGTTVRLPTGAIYLLGGVDADEAPVSSWQVFMPTP